MKFRYKPWATKNIVEFDPGKELICPGCGKIKPVPIGYRPLMDVIPCWGSADTHTHCIAMFCINAILVDLDDNPESPYLVVLMIKESIIFEEDVKDWLERRSLWHIMYIGGTEPKWRVEPNPFWRRNLVKSKA